MSHVFAKYSLESSGKLKVSQGAVWSYIKPRMCSRSADGGTSNHVRLTRGLCFKWHVTLCSFVVWGFALLVAPVGAHAPPSRSHELFCCTLHVLMHSSRSMINDAVAIVIFENSEQ